MEERDILLKQAEMIYFILKFMKHFKDNKKEYPASYVIKSRILEFLVCEKPDDIGIQKELGIEQKILSLGGQYSVLLRDLLDHLKNLKLVEERDATKEDEKEIKEFKDKHPTMKIKTNLTGSNIKIFSITENGEKVLDAYENLRKFQKLVD